jgi:hypothetical protein
MRMTEGAAVRLAAMSNGVALALLLALLQIPACADDKQAHGFKDGCLHGKVLDLTTGKPIPGATVAVTDRKGSVLAWSKTNEKGEYAIAVNTVKALRLHPSRRRGLLEEVVKAVGDVVTAPVKVAANIVKNPKETVTSAAVSVATGNPAPVVAQTVLPAVSPKPGETKKSATEAAVKTVLGERQTARKDDKKDAPGEVTVAVTAGGFRELTGKAGAFWLEEGEGPDGKPCGPRGWLETFKLAPESAPPDKKSIIENEAFLLGEAKLQPSLVVPGGKVVIQAKLVTPAGEKRAVRIFAREEKKRTVVELRPDDKGLYSAELPLDPKLEPGATVVTVCGIRAEPLEVKLDKKKPDPMIEFVRKLDDMDADKPYEFDPRIMACENRLDFNVTVLDPEKATPTAPPSAPAADKKG